MSDIDWLAVESVVIQRKPQILNAEERRAAIRRLEHLMLTNQDWSQSATKITYEQVAWLIRKPDRVTGKPTPISVRSVERLMGELPKATKCVCPDCFEDMWVADGVVEPHPTRYFEKECPSSGCYARTGLAAIRPDLYRWLDVSA